MNKENYLHYDLLKSEIEGIEREMINFCNQYLYPDKEILFKSGNMVAESTGRIIWADAVNQKYIILMIENLNTGKRRKISIEDIIL